MGYQTPDIYTSWRDSRLASRISNDSSKGDLEKIWVKAGQAYPRATWSGWIDHSSAHILGVLRNLDMLIPDYVLGRITEKEAFILIASVLLHDIGMIPEENSRVAPDLQYFANLRLNHGSRAVDIIKSDFAPFLQQDYDLSAVCEIVRNHHGTFSPIPIDGLNFDLLADALWVRLADELDFGPKRGPSWLLEYTKPDEAQLEHWKKHNLIEAPSINLQLFRIQIRGQVENDIFVKKLRAEFEYPSRQTLQKIFLGRGAPAQDYSPTFLIWDTTEVRKPVGVDAKTDPRPTIFFFDQFFLAGRYLYNLGRYFIAIECFEEGIERMGGNWAEMPAMPYFYHYLKALHAVGRHEKAIELVNEYVDADLPMGIRAALSVTKGIGSWKLGDYRSATESLMAAIDQYKILASGDETYLLDAADTWGLYAINYLEKFRANRSPVEAALLKHLDGGIEKAQALHKEYRMKFPELSEPHYTGRFCGVKAFRSILAIEMTPKDTRKPYDWDEALQFASNAHGGEGAQHRNPFGTLCGRYCAAAVNYHKYINSPDAKSRREALLESARNVDYVQKGYDNLFGAETRIPRTWQKVHALSSAIRKALPDGEKSALSAFVDRAEADSEIELFTPIH